MKMKIGLWGCAIVMLFAVLLVFVFGAALWGRQLGDPSGWGEGGGGGCYGPTTGETGTATKGGHSLPATEGKVGQEQHLALKGPTDSPTDFVNNKTDANAPAAQVHYSLSNTPSAAQNGMAGGYGARGKTSSVDEEKYYINMRWGYSTSGGGQGGDPNSQDFWFAPQTILVTNPKNNKQVRAAVIEYGPASWTGRVSGLSPEAMLALGAVTNDNLEYSFASPCQSAQTSAGTGQMTGRDHTPTPTGEIPELTVREDYRLEYKDRGTINPRMVVLHYTAGDSFNGALEALRSKNLSVQIMIDRDGTAYQIMDKLNQMSAGAAGANSWAINIEIVAANTAQLNNQQLQSVIRVVRALATKYSIANIISTDSNNPSQEIVTALTINHNGVFSHQIVDRLLGNNSGKIDPGDAFMRKVKTGLGW